MPESEFLFVVAEIAAAFVGFASVVAILGQRAGGDHVSMDAFRLRVMLEAGLLTLFAALLPVVLHRAGLTESAWRVSSALTAATSVFVVASTVRRYPRAHATPGSRRVAAFSATLFLLSAAILALAAFGVPADTASSYVVAIYLLLVLAAIGLLRVVTSLLAAIPR